MPDDAGDAKNPEPAGLVDFVAVPQWVAWRNEMRDGRWTKVPYCSESRQAEADDASTWLPHDQAVLIADAIVNGSGGGVGIELGRSGERWLVGLDLDTCRDPVSGIVEPWAVAVIQRLNSYTEVSPSQTGIKAFFLIDPAEVPELRSIMGTDHGRQFKRANGSGHPPSIELYLSHRYFTVTWDGLADAPADLRVVPLEDLRWLIEEAGPAFSGNVERRRSSSNDSAENDDNILGRLNTAAQHNRALAAALLHASTMRGGSRSEGALGLGAALWRAGWPYADMKAALLACPATHDWAAEADERQFQRIWDLGREARAKQEPPPDQKTAAPNSTPFPALLDAAAFMATFTNPDYLIDGIIQRGRVHGLTSMTGHGKTAAALYFGCSIATGRNIGNIEVVQGEVVFLAGENPDDLCGRFHAACQVYGIDPAKLPIRVMPGNFPLAAETAETLKQTIDSGGRKTSLIIGDSAAAFFPGDDDNQNVQMGDFARNLRILTGCRGKPGVLVLCHPIKAATKENLLPRGGGAFLNEIDANLTLWAEAQGETSTLHWQGKIRGADFQPLNLSLKQVKLENLKDAKDRPFVSVVAALQTEEQAEKAIRQATLDENTVLEHLRRTPGISVADIASNAHWVSDRGVPNKAKVHRLLKTLQAHKLVKSWRRKWQITEAGRDELSGKSGGRNADC